MYQKIYQHTKKMGFFATHKRVLIAVSSGVDSMNLLHFLHLYKEDLQIEIAIAHINHKQRLESDQEEWYLQNWAQENHIPFFVSHFEGNFSESTAREYRYGFFKEIMVKYNYSALVTAHHANDQAETVLMRIIRGNLLRHLKAIQEIQNFGPGQLIRPFLIFKKEELPNIFHFEDQSNKMNYYFRNRVRNTYLPELEKENPQIYDSLIELSKETQLLFSALTELTKDFDKSDLLLFKKQTSGLQYYLLQEKLALLPDLEISKSQFKDLLYILNTKNNGYFPLKNGYQLILDNKTYVIEKIMLETESQEENLLLEYDSIRDYKGYLFSFKDTSVGENNNFKIPLYDKTPITLRGRNKGDYIDFGSFSKKLRRLFIDEKISIKERGKAIVGLQNGKIIFVLVAGKTYLRKVSENDIMRATLYIENLEKG